MRSKLQPCMENTKSILHRQPIPRLGFIFIKAQIWRSDILTFMSADLYNRTSWQRQTHPGPKITQNSGLLLKIPAHSVGHLSLML